MCVYVCVFVCVLDLETRIKGTVRHVRSSGSQRRLSYIKPYDALYGDAASIASYFINSMIAMNSQHTTEQSALLSRVSDSTHPARYVVARS